MSRAAVAGRRVGHGAEQVGARLVDFAGGDGMRGSEERLGDDIVCVGRTDQHGGEPRQLKAMQASQLLLRGGAAGPLIGSAAHVVHPTI
jgi:hypothetical protein